MGWNSSLYFKDDEDCPVKSGQHYEHYKEKTMYTVICVAYDCESKEKMVVYQAWLSGNTWVRSLEDFTSYVGKEDFTEPRFKLVPQREPLKIDSYEQFVKLFGEYTGQKVNE